MAKAVHDPEFSEFAFGYIVTSGLTHIRSGRLSPFMYYFWRRYWPFIDERHIQCVLINDFDLTKNEAQAITDAFGTPFIPTQRLEARFPVDLAMNSKGIFYFLQFKRSECVSKKHARLIEVVQGVFDDFDKPFYRVKFSGEGDREQRRKLELMEDKLSAIPSALVRYVAPAFHTLLELNEVYQKGVDAVLNGRNAIMCFKASGFDLPGTGDHHISYDADGTSWRFSGDPEM